MTYKWNSTFAKGSDGIYVINLKRTGEKFLLAACAMVATENLTDVSVLAPPGMLTGGLS